VATDPRGHVAIDSSGMLMEVSGGAAGAGRVAAADRPDVRPAGDYPAGRRVLRKTIGALVTDPRAERLIHG
jgi:hypothetical protein